MKKKMNKILLVLVLLILASMNFYISEAAEASISATNCTEGEKVSVIITIPQEVVGYSGTNLYITYSDGTKSSIGRFSKLNYDFNTNTYSPVGNYTISFDGKVAGNATIKVEGLVLTNSSNQQLNSNSSLSTTVYIAPKPVETPVEAPVEKPVDTDKPTENNTGNTSSGNTSSGNTNSNNTVSNNNSNNSSNNNSQVNKPVTPKVLKFKDVNDTVYTTRRINLRQNYGTTGGLIKTLTIGEKLTRTGISTSADENGYYWSRVTYNGTTGYVITSGVTNEKPAEPKNEVTNTISNEVSNNVVNNVENNVTNDIVNNIIDNEVNVNELNKLKEEIGVIPEVGNNIMINMFGATIIVSVILMIIIKRNNYLDED